MTNKITKNTTLAEILKIPGAQDILAKYNLPCLFCPMAEFEMEKLKIGQICNAYKIDTQKLLEELNQKLNKISDIARPKNK